MLPGMLRDCWGVWAGPGPGSVIPVGLFQAGIFHDSGDGSMKGKLWKHIWMSPLWFFLAGVR